MRIAPSIAPAPAVFGAAVVAALGTAGPPPSGLPAASTGSVESCVTTSCHVGIVNRRIVHGPVAHRKCGACHVETDAEAHRFALAADTGVLCTTCHGLSHRTYVHEPVRQGNCTGCHDPHGSEHAKMLVADPARGLCRTCHREDEDAARAFVHGPVAAGACILCHDAHSSWEPALLTEPPRPLCLGCHDELRPDPVRDRYVHAPVADNCLGCHDAHASDDANHLHESSPALCYRCHAVMPETLAAADLVHGAVSAEGGCATCHRPHYSSLPALQGRTEADLCLECHDRPITTVDGRVITDMEQHLDENPDHHGPIREGTCTVCHRPHESSEKSLLRRAYPPEFYAPYDLERYALCFECHIPAMVSSRHGTGATRFRHGDLNLHWLHVNRTKGRTCRACHEVHASRNPFHVRDTVPFGSQGWMLEIRYERRPDGGTCTPGCHERLSYDRTYVSDEPPGSDPGRSP
jgi:predicted CXXCH cytochrome family protein